MKYKGYDFEVRETTGAYIIDRWLSGSYQSLEESVKFLQGEIDKAMSYESYREELSYYSEDNRAYWDDTVPEFGRRVGG